MTLLEYITDLQSQGLSSEEIFAKAQEFKGRTKPEEVVEEVKTEVVPGKVAPVATTPETATEIQDTELKSEDGSLGLQPQGLSNKKGGFGTNSFMFDAMNGIKTDILGLRSLEKKDNNIIQPNEVISKNNYDYKFEVGEDGKGIYFTKQKGEDKWINASNDKTEKGKIAEASIASEFGHSDFDKENYFNKQKELKETEKNTVAEDAEGVGFDFTEEAGKVWDLGVESVKAGFQRLPTFFNEIKMSLAKAISPDEVVKKIESLPPEVQQTIQNFSAVPSLNALTQASIEGYDKSQIEIRKLEDSLIKFENESITEEFEEGNWARGAARTALGIIQTIPALAQAAIPGVGLISLGLTSAAEASAQAQRDGEKVNLNTMFYSSTVGVSEAMLERYTMKLGGKLFKSLVNKPKNSVVRSLRQMTANIAKGTGGEILSESGTLTANKLAESWFLGREDVFKNSFREYMDTAIISGALGFGISGSTAGVQLTRQAAQRNSVKTDLNKTKFKNLFDAFKNDDSDTGSIALSENASTEMFLNADLKKKQDSGEITVEEAKNIKQNFIQTQQAVNQIKPLGLSDGNKPKVVNLLKEKNKLSQEIKKVNETALTEEQSTRVNEINKELNDLVVKDKTAKIDVGAKAVAEQLEVGIETFDTTEDTAGAIETLKNQGGKVDVKNSTDYGTIVEIPNDQGGVDTQIIINKQEAAADNVVTTSQHEVLHAVLSKTTKGNPDATIALGKSLLNELRSDGVNLGGEFEARLDQYVKDPNISEADVMEEVMTLASEGLTNGEITINESTLTKIGNAIKEFFGLNDLNIKFNTGKDVLNFIKDYNKSIQKGEGLTKGQLEVATEGAKGKLIDNAKIEAETIVAKQSKSTQGEQASIKVQEIYDAKGKDGSFEIIEQFAPIVSRIVEKRSEAPNFDRQLLTDEINTGKRGIIDLVAEYKPESGVPLAAYINKFLPARSIEASQRVLGQEFTTDVTEAKAVIATETETETETPKAKRSPTKDKTYSRVLQDNLGQDVSKAIEAAIKIDLEKMNVGDRFGNTKNIGPKLGEVLGKTFKLDPRVFTDKSWNIKQGDLAGLTNLKQYLDANAIKDFKLLPDAYNDKGKSNFIPDNVLNKLYVKDGKNKWKKDNSKTIVDYKALLGEMVKPVYRAAEATTVKGLAALSFRNMIFETAVPSSLDRVGTGVKFSKKDIRNIAIDNGTNPVPAGKDGTTEMARVMTSPTGLRAGFGNLTDKIIVPGNYNPIGNSSKRVIKNKGYFISDINKTDPKDLKETKKDLQDGKIGDLSVIIDIVKNTEGGKEFTKEDRIALAQAIKSQKRNNVLINIKNRDLLNKGKDIFYNGLWNTVDADKNNIPVVLETIYPSNQKANASSGKNIANIINDAAKKEETGYDEHWMPYAAWAKYTGKTFKNKKVRKNWSNHANNNYYQETISLDTQGVIDMSYDITLKNGDIVKWISKSELHPLYESALDKAFETNSKADWKIADRLSDIRKYPGKTLKTVDGIKKLTPVHSFENGFVNPFTHGRYGESDALRYGINVSPANQLNPNIQYEVASVIGEVVQGNITEKAAQERTKKYAPIAVLESKASKKITKDQGGKVNNNMTVQRQIDVLVNYDKTLKFSRALNTKPKGISVFDFDDTLAKTKEKVIVNMLDGKSKEISAAEFAEQASELQEAGATFNFDNFENVGKGTQKGPLADLALKRQGKFGSKDIFVLTARPQIAATDIKMFLDGIGLNLPIENITGLEDGSPQAKATWVISKTAEGYNDFYFADDAIKNVKAVADILDQVDVKSKVQIAKFSKTKTFDKIFNDILESSTGIESYKDYSSARAQTVGASKGKFTFFNTPSAEDFTGLLYKTLGKGKIGDAQMAFYKTNLLDPYNRAELAVTKAKITAANDFKALKRNLKTLPKSLSKQTGIGGFTFSQASRVAAWTRQGMNIPGLSKRDVKELNDFVDNNAELDVFVDELIKIQKGKPYPKPGKSWLGGTITSDILNEINKVNRKAYLQEWQENVDIIFSDKNMNKLEAAYGPNYVEALRDQLARMKSGSNRPIGGSRVVNNVLDWLNNSVGAVMFLNTRSAVLQTLSSVNFINFGNNNIYKAGKAFANQPQFWKDFKTLMNSPYLVERRNGLKINVSESEIADAVAEASNKPKAAISYLLNKGFIFTRIADSFAIAAGGSTFYRNQLDAYVKDGMDVKQAEKRAFDDFYAIAEENQQSSNPSKISQQQASGAGRVILAFANTPMQYARIIKRSSQDLINKRGDWKSNVSKIVYYAAIQNIAFNALQSALFADAFGEEEDDEKQDKTGRIANGMADSLLRGLGIQGAAVSALKNSLLTIANENDKKSPKFVKAVYDLFDFSPPIDSKFRKLRSGANTITWEKQNIKDKGFSLNNPAYLAGAQIISGLTNIPMDRAIQKINNIRAITSNSSQNWQKVAMALGWSTWDVGLPYYGVDDKVEMTPEMILKEKVITMKKETSTKQQKETLLKLGLTKQQIKALKYEEARVKKIIELQEKKDDSKN